MFTGYVDPAWAAGNSLSDSVQLLNARLASGEYVQNAAATTYYGVENMRLLNERKIPREAFSTSRNLPDVNVMVDTGAVVSAITSLHNDLGAIISAASDVSAISDRDLGEDDPKICESLATAPTTAGPSTSTGTDCGWPTCRTCARTRGPTLWPPVESRA